MNGRNSKRFISSRGTIKINRTVAPPPQPRTAEQPNEENQQHTIRSWNASEESRCSHLSTNISLANKQLSFRVHLNSLSLGWNSCDENCKSPRSPKCASGCNSPPRGGSGTCSRWGLQREKIIQIGAPQRPVPFFFFKGGRGRCEFVNGNGPN